MMGRWTSDRREATNAKQNPHAPTPAHLVVLIATCQAAPGRYRGIFGSERRMPTHIMLAMPGYAPFPPDS
ncbi:hypothetical protein CEP54_005224 [Fusarium duplospermum]|uniref:Uncharacterized protein n=1 Tax=Fusarium duplospermum TaxID=1325734 RepID=A0A428QDQ2_9HYPO|nr:hypothetical protein CEP54_005224 [Fusarium duplospermum]